jgi:hypothetical protein
MEIVRHEMGVIPERLHGVLCGYKLSKSIAFCSIVMIRKEDQYPVLYSIYHLTFDAFMWAAYFPQLFVPPLPRRHESWGKVSILLHVSSLEVFNTFQ